MDAAVKIQEYHDHCECCRLLADGSDCEICHALYLSSLSLEELPPSMSQVTSDLQKLFLDYNDLTDIPPSIFTQLQQLRVFSVIGNDLHSLPSSISSASQLEELFLNENLIKELPNNFTSLKHLKILNLVGNQLQCLPEDVDHLLSLQKLHLEENRLECLPDKFGLLTELRFLDLECNKLTCLPPNFGQLSKLTILNLASNKISVLPTKFGDLECLENLDLSTNNLIELPGYMKCSHCLKRFYAENNVIGELPEWVGHLPEVEEMSLKANQLSNEALPVSFGFTSKKLRDLHMGSNSMTSLPDTIGELERLEKIHLGSIIKELERRNFQNGNWLYKIPDSFGKLIMLKSINLEENQLCEIPESFGCLINVEFLDLGQNQLHELPETFGNLHSLRICQLSKNHFELLPSSFGRLSNLEDLRLDHNMLAELPESFRELKNLKNLDLYKNRLGELPDCLESLTSLIRLDVDRNYFDIPYMKIPQVMKSLNYVPLDASKSHNWRGHRTRSDASTVSVILTEEEVANTSTEGYEQPEEINYNLLRNAMKRNMSMWKSHTGPNTREEAENYYRRSIRQVKHSQYTDDESDDPDEAETQQKTCTSSESSVSASLSAVSPYGSAPDSTIGGIATIDDGEDWDQEIKDVPPVDLNPYGTEIPPQREELYEPGYVEYRYIGTEHMFLPSAYHVKAITRPNKSPTIHRTMVTGQFDDMDTDTNDMTGLYKNTLDNGALDKLQREAQQKEEGQFDDTDDNS